MRRRAHILALSVLAAAACAVDGSREAAMDPEQRAAVMDLPDSPLPRQADVASPEAITDAVYASISGPSEAEQPRDWDRFRSLFLPGARFVLARWQSPDEEQVVRAWDVESFIGAASASYRDSAFYESEIARSVERFGRIAHVFSTYESRVGSEDGDPVSRGINGLQVVYVEGRWWIAHLIWDVEQPGNPIPSEYLP